MNGDELRFFFFPPLLSHATAACRPDVELPGVEELVAAAVAASEAAEAEEARDEDEGPLLGEPVVQDFAMRSWAPSPKSKSCVWCARHVAQNAYIAFPAEYLGGDFHRSFGLHHCLASSLLRAGDILECCGIRAVLTAEGKIKCGTRLFPTPSPFVNACCKSTKRGSERSKRNGWGKTTPVLVLSYEKGRRGQPISLFDVRATFMKLAAGQLTSEESWDVDAGLLEQVADGGSAGTRSSSRLRKKKKSHEDDE